MRSGLPTRCRSARLSSSPPPIPPRWSSSPSTSPRPRPLSARDSVCAARAKGGTLQEFGVQNAGHSVTCWLYDPRKDPAGACVCHIVALAGAIQHVLAPARRPSLEDDALRRRCGSRDSPPTACLLASYEDC